MFEIKHVSISRNKTSSFQPYRCIDEQSDKRNRGRGQYIQATRVKPIRDQISVTIVPVDRNRDCAIDAVWVVYSVIREASGTDVRNTSATTKQKGDEFVGFDQIIEVTQGRTEIGCLNLEPTGRKDAGDRKP